MSLESWAMKSNYKKLGPYIREIVEKNSQNQIEKLLGVSIQKCFIPSIANTIGTDMTTYKIVRENQFAYGPVTSRNGDKISVALLQDSDCIISTSYTVFEINRHNELLPEYLMMWFRRPEFDRYARFMSHGSVREIFGWEEMCNVELPIPHIDTQKEIVAEYNTIVNRIKLNEQLNQKLEETAQAIYKQWFVDFEFPDENGNPYKSSGGEFTFDTITQQELPIKWTVEKLGDITTTVDNRGKTPPNSKKSTYYPLIEIASVRTNGRIVDYSKCSKFVSEKTFNSWFRSGHPKQKDVLFSTVGSLAELKLFWGSKGCIAQNLVAFRSKKNIGQYLYQFLLNEKGNLLSYEIGSVQASIKVSHVVEHYIPIPNTEVYEHFERLSEAITQHIYNNTMMCFQLEELRNILLSRMSLI